ncbi:hypothetical protein VVR12_10165 [Rothia sp. LK2588]|uniref:LGFP repeat-containing protein n=1 Tax=Rothia sp. LK2588 TaxID=3114369 RepID=UPI0034CD3543
MKHAAPKTPWVKTKAFKAGYAATLAGAVLAVSSITATTPASALAGNETYASYTASNGVTSQYHVIANNIDWTKPVGVVFFMDGDHHNKKQTTIHNPSGASLQAIGQVANSHNMVLVPVVSPDKDGSRGGFTWWEDKQTNGKWFRDFAQNFIAEHGIDSTNVWTLGQSGGSEFIGYELGANSQESWRNGGGDIMVGGGNSDGMKTDPSAAYRKIPMYWYVGTNDNVKDSNAYGWSAYRAALSGKATYDANGFTNTHLVMVPNTNHFQYNHAQILDDTLNRNTTGATWSMTTLTTASNKTQAVDVFDPQPGYQAIADYYYQHGGLDKLGYATAQPTFTNARGITQNFSSEKNIYWTEATGAHTIAWKGAIGDRFARQGFENGWGYPSIDETSYAGGAKQYFENTYGATAVYWSKATGAHSLVKDGAIRTKWVNHGHAKTLGFPATDEIFMDATGVAGPGAKASFVKDGERTVAYWSDDTGAHIMNEKGAIHAAWQKFGGAAWMGYPVTDETTDAHGVTSVTFSNGTTLNWTAQSGVWVS